MKIFYSGKRQMLAFFVPGFLLGVIYLNLIAKKNAAEPEVFSELFLSGFDSVRIEVQSYLPYLLRIRLVPLVVLAVLSSARFRKAAAVAFLVWTGFTAGIVISAAACGLGLKGSLLCAAALLPQFFFYVPAYVVVLWYCLSAPRTQWNRQKTVFVVIAAAAGIMLELYVNPVLVRGLLSIFPAAP